MPASAPDPTHLLFPRRGIVSTTTATPVKVFIAEDNPILLQGLERALTANGYVVQTAADGRAMLDLLEGPELPDVLLVDVMMPGMNGIDLLDAVRSEPRTSDLPVVLITAAADELLPKSSRQVRDLEVLMKPFRLNELLERIEDRIRPRRSRERANHPAQSPGVA